MRSLGRAYNAVASAAVIDRFNETARGAGVAVIATTMTAQPFVISAITASGFIPWLLFGLPVGLLLDVYPRRTVAVAASICRGVLALVAVLVTVAGWLNPGVLLVIVFVLATLQVVADTAINTLLPTAVPPDQIGVAVGRMSSGQSTASVLAPPVGSAFTAIWWSFPFSLSAGLGFVAAVLIGRLPREPEPADRGDRQHLGGLFRSVGAGLATIRSNRTLSTLLGTVFISNLCNGARLAMLPLLVMRILDLSPRVFGVIAAVQAIAMIGGNLVAGRVMKRRRHLVALIRSTLFSRLPAFLLIALATSRWPIYLGVIVLGLSYGIWNVVSSSIVMTLSAGEARARTISANKTIAVVGAPIGALIAGAGASVTSPRTALVVAGLLTVVSATFFTVRGGSADHLLPGPDTTVRDEQPQDKLPSR